MCTGWRRRSTQWDWSPRRSRSRAPRTSSRIPKRSAAGTSETRRTRRAGGECATRGRRAWASAAACCSRRAAGRHARRVAGAGRRAAAATDERDGSVRAGGGFGEELAEETAATAAGGRAPPTLVQPRRRDPASRTHRSYPLVRAHVHTLRSNRPRARSGESRAHAAADAARAARVRVRAPLQARGRPPVGTFSQTVRLHRRGAGLFRRARRPAPSHFPGPEQSPGPAANDLTQPVRTYEPLDDSRYTIYVLYIYTRTYIQLLRIYRTLFNLELLSCLVFTTLKYTKKSTYIWIFQFECELFVPSG